MARLIGSAAEFDKKEGENFSDYMDRTNALLEEILGEEKSIPPDQLVGRLIKFPVADGYAWYQVYKEKPLQLLFIPVGDAYSIPGPYIRGLTLADVKQKVRADIKMQKLFATKPVRLKCSNGFKRSD